MQKKKKQGRSLLKPFTQMYRIVYALNKYHQYHCSLVLGQMDQYICLLLSQGTPLLLWRKGTQKTQKQIALQAQNHPNEEIFNKAAALQWLDLEAFVSIPASLEKSNVWKSVEIKFAH